MTSIIFIEGISGVGKSTTTKSLSSTLIKSGYNIKFFLEGDKKSPLDLFQVAYLDKNELLELINQYPTFESLLINNSSINQNYCLVDYQDEKKNTYPIELYQYLKNKEVCYRPKKPIDITIYQKIFMNLWKEFSDNYSNSNLDYIIMDGSLLHHQINDMIRNYHCSKIDICNYLTNLIKIVSDFNPRIFYLSSKNIKERLEKAFVSRNQPLPSDRQIRFWKKRKQIDLFMLEQLGIESYTYDISLEDWKTTISSMVSQINHFIYI